MKRALQIFTLSVFLIPLLLAAGYCSYSIYHLSKDRSVIKTDYSTVNNISYGLLSVDAWKNHLILIVTHRIDDFEFTRKQEKLIKNQLEQVLHAVIDKADSLVQKKQKTLKGKLKKFAVNALIKEEKIHAQVPVFSQTILDEIKKPENKARLKAIALEQIEKYGAITYDSSNDVARINAILLKYNAKDLNSFNNSFELKVVKMDKELYNFSFVILSIVAFYLILWWILRRQKQLHNLLFVSSVLLALILLSCGLTAPMIEIDARIKEMSFLLMGEQISFHDQVIFYQSKSIVDVVGVLMDTGKWDSMLIGILILVFSILFPMAKLISSKFYLFGNSALQNNRVVKFFAFKSGKWSMADVYVVAIFMAYIGFKGIIDSQLKHLNMKTQSLASISTNETTLQPGFILFVAFVLFGLILSTILEKIKNRTEVIS